MSQSLGKVFELSDSESDYDETNRPQDNENVEIDTITECSVKKFPSYENSTRNDYTLIMDMPDSISIQPVKLDEKKPLREEDLEVISRDSFRTNFATLRWKGSEDNVKSNGRIVKWSDGSFTLQIGANHVPIAIKSKTDSTPSTHMIPDPSLKDDDAISAIPFTATNVHQGRLEMAHTAIDTRHRETIERYLSSKK